MEVRTGQFPETYSLVPQKSSDAWDTKIQCLFELPLFSSEDQDTVCVDQKLQERSHHSTAICRDYKNQRQYFY